MVAIGVFTVAGVVLASGILTTAWFVYQRMPELREVAIGMAVVAGSFLVFTGDIVWLAEPSGPVRPVHVLLYLVSLAWAAGIGVGLAVIGVGLSKDLQARRRAAGDRSATVEFSPR